MNNFKFENKTILILSPEKWGKMMLSKHHYAIELSRKNNITFFVVYDKQTKGIKIEQTEYNNLFYVRYSTFFPYILKFHSRKIFDFLMKYQIKNIIRKINKPIDIVWCFDFNLYSNLNDFNAKIKIYHPVDPVSKQEHINPAKTADIIFSISEKILSSFDKINKPKFFINHGLSKEFQKIAQSKHSATNTKEIKVGYFGNLLRPILDTKILKQIISENNNVKFIFWGSYENKQSNIGGSDDNKVIDFIKFLKSQKNVTLKGVKQKNELVVDILNENIDIFILVYKFAQGSDRSNAHKLMEYLATGKVIVANKFTTYEKQNDLIIMPNNDDDSQIPELFKKVISNLNYYNSAELQRKRIEFALDNTYEKQIGRIEKIISENIYE